MSSKEQDNSVNSKNNNNQDSKKPDKDTRIKSSDKTSYDESEPEIITSEPKTEQQKQIEQLGFHNNESSKIIQGLQKQYKLKAENKIFYQYIQFSKEEQEKLVQSLEQYLKNPDDKKVIENVEIRKLLDQFYSKTKETEEIYKQLLNLSKNLQINNNENLEQTKTIDQDNSDKNNNINNNQEEKQNKCYQDQQNSEHQSIESKNSITKTQSSTQIGNQDDQLSLHKSQSQKQNYDDEKEEIVPRSILNNNVREQQQLKLKIKQLEEQIKNLNQNHSDQKFGYEKKSQQVQEEKQNQIQEEKNKYNKLSNEFQELLKQKENEKDKFNKLSFEIEEQLKKKGKELDKQYKSDLKQMEEANLDLQKKCEGLQNEQLKHTQLVQDLLDQFDDKSSQSDKKLKKNAQRKEQSAEQKQELSQKLKIILQEREHTLKKLEKDNAQLKDKNKILNDQIEKLQNGQKSLELSNKQNIEELTNNHKQELQKQEDKYQNLKEENQTNIYKQSEKHKNAQLILEQQHNQQVSKIEKEFGNQISDLESLLKQTKLNCSNQVGEIQKLKKNISTLEIEKEEQSKTMADQKTQILNKDNHIIKLDNKIKDYQNDINTKDKKIESLKTEISINLKTIQTQEDKISQYSEEINQQKTKIKNLTKKVQELETEKSDLQQKVEKKVEKITNLEQNIQNLNQQISNLQQSEKELNQKNKEMQENIKFLSSSLSTCQNENKKLKLQEQIRIQPLPIFEQPSSVSTNDKNFFYNINFENFQTFFQQKKINFQYYGNENQYQAWASRTSKVVSIIGQSQTGKSYVLQQLTGQQVKGQGINVVSNNDTTYLSINGLQNNSFLFQEVKEELQNFNKIDNSEKQKKQDEINKMIKNIMTNKYNELLGYQNSIIFAYNFCISQGQIVIYVVNQNLTFDQYLEIQFIQEELSKQKKKLIIVHNFSDLQCQSAENIKNLIQSQVLESFYFEQQDLNNCETEQFKVTKVMKSFNDKEEVFAYHSIINRHLNSEGNEQNIQQFENLKKTVENIIQSQQKDNKINEKFGKFLNDNLNKYLQAKDLEIDQNQNAINITRINKIKKVIYQPIEISQICSMLYLSQQKQKIPYYIKKENGSFKIFMYIKGYEFLDQTKSKFYVKSYKIQNQKRAEIIGIYDQKKFQQSYEGQTQLEIEQQYKDLEFQEFSASIFLGDITMNMQYQSKEMEKQIESKHIQSINGSNLIMWKVEYDEEENIDD